MVANSMAVAAKKSAKKPQKTEPDPLKRKKSLLTQAGDKAKWETERAMLLEALREHDWNLTHTAKALEMGAPSAVLAAIQRYKLTDEKPKN